MLKVVKVRVGKGRTSRPSEAEEWLKEYYELEIEIGDDKELPVARDFALTQIDSWLAQAPTAPEYIPHLDIAEISELPWKDYKTKQPSTKPDSPAWAFSNADGAEELVKAINASKDGKVQIGNVEFSFSGDSDQFISRRPVKQKK